MRTFKWRCLLLSAVFATGCDICGDEPFPCEWLADRATEEWQPAPEVEIVCNGNVLPAELNFSHDCHNCDPLDQNERVSVVMRAESPSNSKELVYLEFILPAEQVSGEDDLKAPEVVVLNGIQRVDSGRFTWQRSGNMPFVDIDKDDIEEGVVYTDENTFTVDLEGDILIDSSCETSSIRVVGLQRTAARSGPVRYCEPIEIEDLRDLRFGH